VFVCVSDVSVANGPLSQINLILIQEYAGRLPEKQTLIKLATYLVILFLSYPTDSTDSRTIQCFYSAQRLDLFTWCVRL